MPQCVFAHENDIPPTNVRTCTSHTSKGTDVSTIDLRTYIEPSEVEHHPDLSADEHEDAVYAAAAAAMAFLAHADISPDMADSDRTPALRRAITTLAGAQVPEASVIELVAFLAEYVADTVDGGHSYAYRSTFVTAFVAAVLLPGGRCEEILDEWYWAMDEHTGCVEPAYRAAVILAVAAEATLPLDFVAGRLAASGVIGPTEDSTPAWARTQAADGGPAAE